jgi:hypothetical protein
VYVHPVRAFLKICSKPRNLRLLHNQVSLCVSRTAAYEFKYIHGQVDAGVESQTTLVRAKGRVELDSEGAVHLQLAVVVLPHDTELDNTFWDGGDSQGGAVFGVIAEEGAVLESAHEFCECVSAPGSRIKTRLLGS